MGSDENSENGIYHAPLVLKTMFVSTTLCSINVHKYYEITRQRVDCMKLQC